MTQPQPPFAWFKGGEDWSDTINMVTLIHGADAVDDGNFPGYVVPDYINGPDTNEDSHITVPQTYMPIRPSDMPNDSRDYPVRQCSLSGKFGARHAMVSVEGRWYLRSYARDTRRSKRYPPLGGGR